MTAVMYCYILFIGKAGTIRFTTGPAREGPGAEREGDRGMKLIVNGSSMVPIYEQIIEQIKRDIRKGILKEGEVLPSVRSLSRELNISALTVKKAYDNLEEEGFTVTVHGKGTYVACINPVLLEEEQKKEVEEQLQLAIQKGRRYGLQDEELRALFELLLEEG